LIELEILHFEQLKSQIQAQYLQNHTPSYDDISKWKGIDIIYFQEDLRKIAKGNISEKSFYTYFKNSPVTKIPRIDMLNILSVYAGYQSWFEFKKHNKFPDEIIENDEQNEEHIALEIEEKPKEESFSSTEPQNAPLVEKNNDTKPVLQNNNTVNQEDNTSTTISKNTIETAKPKNVFIQRLKQYLWLGLSIIFGICAALLGFKDEIFGKTFTYCFTDADRSAGIQTHIEIKVYKENESPLLFKIKPGQCFHYPTKDKNLVMEISSPFYENLKVTRNLENASKEETIELKPDDYKFAFYYFSKMGLSGNDDLINQKRRELENRISEDAVIKQIYDSDIYGVENISKEKYITLVTTPTTSLKNLNLIEMKRNEKGKIISIKFKITNNEKK